MRITALAVFATSLAIASLSAQSKQLERALERIEKNDVNGLRRLLQDDRSLVQRTEAGVVPHWQWTLLHAATAGGASLEIVGALIDAGAEVNPRDNEGNTPLHFAMKRIGREKVPVRDYEGIIRLLLEKKARRPRAQRRRRDRRCIRRRPFAPTLRLSSSCFRPARR